MKPDQIKELRKRLKMTQQEFAPFVGVSFNSINRWERGRNKPCPLAIAKMQGLINNILGN